jgi:hypothetical protein
MYMRYINTACAVVGAVSASAIPLVLAHNTEVAQKNNEAIALKARTLEFLGRLDQDVFSLLERKYDLDHANGVKGENSYSIDYIDNPGHYDVQTQVYRLLNLYEFTCIGMKNGLFAKDVVEDMRGDALRQTFLEYQPYILAHRKLKPQNANAWNACDTFICASVAQPTDSTAMPRSCPPGPVS